MVNQHSKTVSKLISLCLLAVVIFSVCTSAQSLEQKHSESFRSSIFYARLCNVDLTGDPRTDIMNIAMSQLGYVEGNSKNQYSGLDKGSKNFTEYGLWYDGTQGTNVYHREAWCAVFVSWCAHQAGISEDIFYSHAYTPYGLNWYTDQDLTFTREEIEAGVYTPQPGDVIYYRSPGVSRKTNHVGLVYKYEDGILYAIEGNTNSGDNSTDGGSVCLKSYSITDTFIRYICTPAYDKT